MNTLASTTVAFALIGTIDSSVESIIEFSKKLYRDSVELGKKEWRQSVNTLGWKKEIVKNYVNIGKAFEGVDSSLLSGIEPSTLFKITKNKKFSSVIDSIKNHIGNITQQYVQNLIDGLKAPRQEKEENATIWRGEKDGPRTCVVPPIKEDDQFTGMAIQRAMDSEHITAQRFVREAAALREALDYGAIQLNVKNLPDHLRAVISEFMYIEPETGDNAKQGTAEEASIYEYEEYEAEDIDSDSDLEPHRRQPSSSVTPTINNTFVPDMTTGALYVKEINISKEIEELRVKLLACTSYPEVEAIINNLAPHTRDTVWSTFTTEQKRSFKNMRIRFGLNIADSADKKNETDIETGDANRKSENTDSVSNYQGISEFGQEFDMQCMGGWTILATA